MAAQLTREIATMVANMRSITNQNMAVQELLKQRRARKVIQSLPMQPKNNSSRKVKIKTNEPHLLGIEGELAPLKEK